MTFLPIVERELLVAARRGRTHWVRFALTAGTALLLMRFFLGFGVVNPAVMGQAAFVWLSSTAFVLACAACLLTADTLSAERREGTLGLLFLTELRSWDITLGKLASGALGAVYAGLAFTPLLMLPVVAGGVTGWEAARTALALLAGLLVSLGAGLAASAREVVQMRAWRQAGLWVAGTVGLPALWAWLAPSAGLPLGLLSPLMTLLQAQDTAYRTAPAEFWTSLAIQFLHAGLLVTCAGAFLRRSPLEALVQERPRSRLVPQEPAGYSSEPFSNASYLAVNPPRPARPRSRSGFVEAHLLQWLVDRQRGQRALCWTAAGLLCLSSPGWILQPFLRWFPTAMLAPVAWPLLSGLALLAKALLAWAACRFLFEARRSGELELLLATPVGARTLIEAHWAAMKRRLRGPVALILIPVALHVGAAFLLLARAGAGGTWGISLLLSALYPFLNALELLSCLLAINWLGMWFGLTARRLANAVALTLAWAVGLPMLLHFLWSMTLWLLPAPGRSGSNWMAFWWLGSHLSVCAALLALSYGTSHYLRGCTPAQLVSRGWRDVVRDLPRQLAAWVRACRRWRA